MERRSGGNVSFGQAAAIFVPRHRARRKDALVSVRSEDDSRDDGRPWFIHGVGFDITERKGLEEAILEISAREQRRIAQDLHDGLGQHLTGIAFMSKVLEEKLSDKSSARSRGSREDRQNGESGDRQYAPTGARPSSGGGRAAGIDVRAEKVGERGGGAVSHSLHVSNARSRLPFTTRIWRRIFIALRKKPFTTRFATGNPEILIRPIAARTGPAR